MASVCVWRVDNVVNYSQMEMTQVNAIRNGSLDSLYETMQGLDENEGPGASSEPSDALIEVGHSNKDKEVTNSRK